MILSNQESIPELREFVSWAKSEKKSNFESSTHKGFGNRINNNLSSDDKIYTLAEIISESEKLLESKEKRSFSCFFNILRFETESSNFYYDSCINEKCSKKVTLDSSGLYKCEQCQKLFEEVKNFFLFFLEYYYFNFYL